MNAKLSASLRKGAIIGASLCAFSFAGWGTANASDYYQQFGGKAGITALINTFVGNVANDPHINMYFAHTNQIVALWKAAGDARNLKMVPVPRAVGATKSANYFKPSMFFSIIPRYLSLVFSRSSG